MDRIQKGQEGFHEHEARVLLAEIVLGIKHMHDARYIHRDIKVENIMLDAAGHIKLIDFGLCRKFEPSQPVEAMSPIGSLIYVSHLIGSVQFGSVQFCYYT